MRRPALLALAAAVLVPLATTAPAQADGTYFAFGMGPGEVSDELGTRVHDTISARIGLGHRLGNWAFEGYLAPESSVDGHDHDGGGRDFAFEAVRLGVDARYILPISKHLQVYARGGLSKMSATLTDHDGPRDSFGTDYAGRGFGGGAGVQLRGRVRALGFLYWPLFFLPAGPKVDAALTIDHGVDFYRLHREDTPERPNSIDARFTRLHIGFQVGADF